MTGPQRDAEAIRAARGPAGVWFLRRARGNAGSHCSRAWFLSAPCAYCLGVATSVDHIVAKSRGGTLTSENTAPACGDCNLRKGDLPLLVFLAKRRASQPDRPQARVAEAPRIRDRRTALQRAAAYVAENRRVLDVVLDLEWQAYNRRRRRR